MSAQEKRWSVKLEPYVPTRLYRTGCWHFAYPCGTISTHYHSEYACRVSANKAKQLAKDLVGSIQESVRAAFLNLKLACPTPPVSPCSSPKPSSC